MTYRVTWEIDIEAGSPLAAAKKALKIQRDPSSIATVFDVGYHLTKQLKRKGYTKTSTSYKTDRIDLTYPP